MADGRETARPYRRGEPIADLRRKGADFATQATLLLDLPTILPSQVRLRANVP